MALVRLTPELRPLFPYECEIPTGPSMWYFGSGGHSRTGSPPLSYPVRRSDYAPSFSSISQNHLLLKKHIYMWIYWPSLLYCNLCVKNGPCRTVAITGSTIFTVPERKFVTNIPVRYHDPRWRRQKPVRMFTLRFLIFRIVFHVFGACYRTIVCFYFYVIPKSVLEFAKTVVNWHTKNTEDLGNSLARSW